jgi:enediyne biosynthesis protein E4
MKIAGLVFPLLLLVSGCVNKPEKKTAFTLMKNCGIDFSNTLTNTPEFNIFNYRNFYNGGGAAIGDLNNDGLPEVFFTANMGSNKLFLNKGNFSFEDISAKAGIEEALKWSTGVVLADINNDGWLDIYVCNAGYQKGQAPRNALFINNKDLSFTDQAAAYGLADAGYTTHAAFFDYDLDGDLDAYILNNSFIPVNTINYSNKRDLRAEKWPVADYLKGGGDRLLRNDGGKFTDVSEAAHIYGSLIGFGLGVAIGDVNGDRYPDIYVSNDFFEKDYLYINQKNGSFKEDLESRIQHISHSSMGVDIGDINNDDHADIFVSEMLPDQELRLKTTTAFENIDIQKLKQNAGFFNQFQQNTLQVSNGNGGFYETAFYSGVAASDWSWGGLIFDADNDGLNDIYVCNGIYNDVTDQDFIDFFANDVVQKMVLTGNKEDIPEIISKMPSNAIANKMFRNNGDLIFEDKAAEWGMQIPSFSNGSAYGDLDNDGDLDLVVNNVNAPAFVYRNNSRELNKNNFISFQLKGGAQNPFAVGSLVKVFAGKNVLSKELFPARGYQSSVDYTIIVGLGKQVPDSVEIIWPDLSVSTIVQPAVNQLHQVNIAAAGRKFLPAAETAVPWFSVLPENSFEPHKEDDFTDFNTDRNSPFQLSREGPHLSIADVDKDGRADVFIGGAAGQPGQLYLQQQHGFIKSRSPVFEQHKAAEDVAVLFFDADKDGDPDLFIGAGGNNSYNLPHRLYINDGKGNFAEMPVAFPPNEVNIAVAAADDIDGDGDLDLFVGGRSVPGQYGLTPSSYIYLNNGGGHFTDATLSYNAAISKLGLVTDAKWADITGDRKNELIVVGEWMSPKIFTSDAGRLVELPTNLDSYKGLWQSLTIGDLDGDGKNDLLLGNVGKNNYLGAGHNLPVKIWINDFDENGTTDKVLSKNAGGKDLPVYMKRELTDQLPALQKQNLKHAAYAKKSVQDLFAKSLIDSAEVKIWQQNGSCIAWNEGKGRFNTQLLPYQLQLSSINAAAVADVSGDGLPDIITAGNLTNFQPQFGAIDAGYGRLLLNLGHRNFTVANDAETGLMLTGVTRGIGLLKFDGELALVCVRNNDKPICYLAKKIIKK